MASEAPTSGAGAGLGAGARSPSSDRDTAGLHAAMASITSQLAELAKAVGAAAAWRQQQDEAVTAIRARLDRRDTPSAPTADAPTVAPPTHTTTTPPPSTTDTAAGSGDGRGAPGAAAAPASVDTVQQLHGVPALSNADTQTIMDDLLHTHPGSVLRESHTPLASTPAYAHYASAMYAGLAAGSSSGFASGATPHHMKQAKFAATERLSYYGTFSHAQVVSVAQAVWHNTLKTHLPPYCDGDKVSKATWDAILTAQWGALQWHTNVFHVMVGHDTQALITLNAHVLSATLGSLFARGVGTLIKGVPMARTCAIATLPAEVAVAHASLTPLILRYCMSKGHAMPSLRPIHIQCTQRVFERWAFAFAGTATPPDSAIHFNSVSLDTHVATVMQGAFLRNTLAPHPQRNARTGGGGSGGNGGGASRPRAKPCKWTPATVPLAPSGKAYCVNWLRGVCPDGDGCPRVHAEVPATATARTPSRA